MLSFSRARWVCGLILTLGLVVPGQAAQAEKTTTNTNSERVKFDTFDQVEIHGAYYASSKGNKGPCVMLLHELDGNSQQEGWNELATELQKKGYSVLIFDFRGHGDSTSIGQNFYNLDPVNKSLKSFASARTRDKISYKDFTSLPQYLMLLNDIAAAKRFLDRKNDSGECNSSDTIVIGAGSGATLGALWIWTEWQRRNQLRNPAGFIIGTGEPEGKNIACAVWLSISQTLRTHRVRLEDALRSPVREKMPMYFLFGENDRSAQTSKTLHDRVLHANTDKSLKDTGMKAIPGSNKLAGRELLGKKSLGTEELIIKYLDKVMEDRGATVWVKHDVERTQLFPVPIQAFLR